MAVEHSEAVVGLANFLQSRGLAAHRDAVSVWCQDNGAGFLHEVLDNKEEVADFLGLSELERQRLTRPAETLDLARACSANHAPKLVPSSLPLRRVFTAPPCSAQTVMQPAQFLPDSAAVAESILPSKATPAVQTATTFCGGTMRSVISSGVACPLAQTRTSSASFEFASKPISSTTNTSQCLSAPAKALPFQQQGEPMIRCISTSPQASGSIQHAMAPISSFGSMRTRTSPVTGIEQAAAEQRASAAFVPLQAWPIHVRLPKAQPPPSNAPFLDPPTQLGGYSTKLTARYLRSTLTPKVQAKLDYGLSTMEAMDLRRPAKAMDHGLWTINHEKPCVLAEDDVLVQLGFEKGAALEANRRYTRPYIPNACLAVPVSPKLLSSRRSKPEKSPGLDFSELQDIFKKRYADELQYAFGPDAIVSHAPVSVSVQKQFCNALATHPHDEVRLGFHGTRRNNYDKIFCDGLKVPGSGGVRVVNGSAHGVGIYTAKLGAAELSKGFSSDNNSMIVCGIIDEPDEISMKLPNRWRTQPQQQLLKCGRLPKRPENEKAPANFTQAQRTMGNYSVVKETNAVRHVGQAQVIFDDTVVVPLLKVDHQPGPLYRGSWFPSEPEPVFQKQETVEMAAAEWLLGNPNLRTVAPPAEEAKEKQALTQHEIAVRRARAQRSWQQDRKEQRGAKQSRESA